ncbi:MAG TPA: ABC transporter permease, partial [Balneolaceae bacterium]|nr:ABC transporter permease [Balneolaceae bacterium]
MLTLKLAWRNIWRSKRRTLITMSSIVVAVLLSAVMRSMQEGQYDMMISTTVGSFSGHIQLHSEGYWDEQTINNSFDVSDSLMQTLKEPKGITAIVPRIESFALGAGKMQSRPVMVLGIDVNAENKIIEPEKNLVSGKYLEDNDERAVLVGKDVLPRLNLQLGDSLVLIGQGFRGMSATGLYPVKGTISLINPELNRTLVLLPINTAQQFLAAEGRLSTIALMLENTDAIESTIQSLKQNLPEDTYEIMGWREMLPELVQAIDIDRISGYIMLAVLYMVVGFGILGTVLMMVTERTYEFVIMLSVGTPRKVIARILGIEIFIISMLGSGIGILLALPIAWYFKVNPIQISGDMATYAQ